MKQIRSAAIGFTVFMLVVLSFLITKLKTFSFSVGSVDSYTDEELKIYRNIWQKIIHDIEAETKELFIWFLILWIIFLVCGYLLMFIIYRTQIKPVRELEDFATEISKGNLDIPLPIRKGNSSDSFTESFDRMREELKASKEREMAAERAKREMVAELSHDLKTPVATIKATCEVLEMTYRKKADEELKTPGQAADNTGIAEERDNILEKIGYIAAKAETINKLVENVFRANLDDMDEVKINVGEYDSREIQRFFEEIKDYGNIIIDNDIPACLVKMDKLRMEQVIDNVIGNSYKYAGTDIHVSFDAAAINLPTGNKQQFIEITIKDSGAGVPEDELPLIVEKYYRGKNSAEKTGYGLGLYLVKMYMEKQGGGMECFNDNGFTVKLYVSKV